MQTTNELYQNQGIHVIVTLLTVENNKFKVLLIKRKKQPFQDHWCLLGGAVYNNETLDNAILREMKEKTQIVGVIPEYFGLFSKPNRAKETGFRMLGVGYLGLVDSSLINFVKESEKTADVEWWNIDEVPKLAYDHKEILEKAIEYLRKQIFKSNLIKKLFPNYVTIPELQKTYETILDKQFDRRNFRKKILSIGLVVDTGLYSNEKGKKPAKLYSIQEIKDDINL
ncbi:MAG: NUDIX domain-containing protein [Clostridia bacterium]|nr:NUDIX domain-containing protein [Clostridia bacterium]